MAASGSPTYQHVFADAVPAFEMREPGDPSLLTATEAAHVHRAVAKRRNEFAAGRQCARRALAELGARDAEIGVAADRRPLWPPQFVGSITHTEGFCAAVAGRAVDYHGIGIDTERVAPVMPGFAARICVAQELEWLEALPPEARTAGALLVFCVKEAFYKSQYPVTGEPLWFRDVRLCEVSVSDAGGVAAVLTAAGALTVPTGVSTAPTEVPTAQMGEFLVEPMRPLAMARYASLPLRGRFRFHERFVSSGIALPAR